MGEESAFSAADRSLGGYLVFGQKAGCGLWYSRSWVAPYLRVASVQLRGFLSPQSGLAGRRKEEHHLQGPCCGTETQKHSRRSNSRCTSMPSRDRKETPLRGPGVNVWRFSGLRAKTLLFARAQWVGRSVLPCRSRVKCTHSRLSSRKA